MVPTLSIFLLVLVVAAVLAAQGLRRLGLSGWSVAGGLAVGVLLGPTISGRVAPDFYEQQIIGAKAEREALFRAEREHGANRMARQHAGFDPVDRLDRELEERQREERLRAALHDARRAHQRPLIWLTLGVAAAFLLLGGAQGRRRREPTPDWYAAVSIGLWSAFIPGAAVFLTLRLLEYTVIDSAAAAAAISIGAVMLHTSERRTAEDAEPGGARLMHLAARIAAVAALGLLGIAAWRSEAPLATTGWLIGIGAFVAGCLVDRISPISMRAAIEAMIVPAMTALIAVRLEVFAEFRFWPLVLALVLSGDGRWLGAYLGAMLSTARKTMPTMRLALAAMSAGTAQIAIIAIGLACELLSPSLALALLLGAILMEMTGGTRRRFAQRLREAESQLAAEEDGEDDHERQS